MSGHVRRIGRTGRSGRVGLAVLLAAASIGWLGDARSSAAAPAQLISVAPGSSAPLAMDSYTPSVSGDGNIVVFNASTFNSELKIAEYTVYVRNRSAGTTTAIPGLPQPLIDYPGTTDAVVSRDGCHVAFWGRYYFDYAAGNWRVYTWDRCTAGSTPIEVASTQIAAYNFPVPLATSADGRYIVYTATPPSGLPRVARLDTTTLTDTALNVQFSNVSDLDISDDGNYIAVSGQRQAVAGGPVLNEVLGWSAPCTTTCTTDVISVGSNGQPATGYNNYASVSADGRYVAFVSDGVGILGPTAQPSSQVLVRDRVAGVTKLVTDTPGQPMIPTGIGVGEPEISPDGAQIVLTETDSGETSNVWVARSSAGYFDDAVFDLVSYGVSGAGVGGPGAGNPSMSSNGRYVAFSSPQNDQLSGGTVPNGNYQIWMRDRPIQLDITPTVDFGTVDVGGQSAPKSAVVTNTSGVEINIASVTPPSAPFAVTANSCGGVLAAGATCAVTMVFRPTAAGGASSSLTVAGDGLSITASLVGVGLGAGTLKIAPTSVSFGSAVVGSVLPPKPFVVSNTGQAAVTITGVTLNGSGADQFAITTNGCTGSLAPGASCAIQVGATVTRDGSLSATLRVVGAGGQSAQATLRLGGEFTPTLTMNPGVVSPSEVTTATGAGFPPNIDVDLTFDGEPTPFATVHTDPNGAFTYSFLLLPHSVRIGGRQVLAVDQPAFSGVFAPLLIELATSRPSGFSSPQFFSGVRSLLTRGG